MRMASASRSPYRPPRFLAVVIKVRHSSSVRYSRTRTSLFRRRRGGVAWRAACAPATSRKATFPFVMLDIVAVPPGNPRDGLVFCRATFYNLVIKGKVGRGGKSKGTLHLFFTWLILGASQSRQGEKAASKAR